MFTVENIYKATNTATFESWKPAFTACFNETPATPD